MLKVSASGWDRAWVALLEQAADVVMRGQVMLCGEKVLTKSDRPAAVGVVHAVHL